MNLTRCHKISCCFFLTASLSFLEFAFLVFFGFQQQVGYALHMCLKIYSKFYLLFLENKTHAFKKNLSDRIKRFEVFALLEGMNKYRMVLYTEQGGGPRIMNLCDHT